MSLSTVDAILQDPRFRGSPLGRETTREEYDEIRAAFLTHVAAEERLFSPATPGVWAAQMAEMLGVFSRDCVMEVVQTGQRWDGHAGAEAFYRAFIPAFADMRWVPMSVVVGPQGVLDVAEMTGLQRLPFGGLDLVGHRVHLQWVIAFPWLPDERKFRGETIWSIRALTA